VNSWKVILAAVVIFGAGVLTGGLLVNYVDHWHWNLQRPRPPEIWRKDFLEHLDKALKLTSAQHDAIKKIISDGQERNRQIWTNAAPEMRQTLEEVHRQIRAELTPDQQKRFEKLLKRFAPQRDNAPPGPPPSTNPPPPAPDL
jgi:Spy/CpxP family protein refolding chaperone